MAEQSPPLPAEAPKILRDLNSWWFAPHRVRPAPPRYRRRGVASLQESLRSKRPVTQVLRGPRQVEKTTALYQIVHDQLSAGADRTTILLVRFDLQPIQESTLRAILRWYEQEVLGKPLARPTRMARPPLLFLDEIHKLDRWSEPIKHLHDTNEPRMVLTGSSSVLVARGQRESLAGRALTIDFPPFLFRESAECWKNPAGLPPPKGCPTAWTIRR